MTIDHGRPAYAIFFIQTMLTIFKYYIFFCLKYINNVDYFF